MPNNKQNLSSQDVLNYAQLIAELTPLALELALKLQGIFSQTNANAANTLNTQALTQDTEVIAKVNAWLTSKGLPTQ